MVNIFFVDWASVILTYLIVIIFIILRYGYNMYMVSEVTRYTNTTGVVFITRLFALNWWLVLPILVLTSSLRSPEFLIFSSSIFWSPSFTKLLNILILFNALQPLILFTKYNNLVLLKLDFNTLIPLFFTVLNISIIFFWNVTSLIPFIVSIEVINTTILSLAVICIYGTRVKTRRLNTLLTLFWINAFSSFLLFIIFNFQLIFNIGSTDYSLFRLYSDFNCNQLKHLPLPTSFITSLLNLLLLLVFFFKLSLPPFIYWKIIVFENSNLYFTIIYNIPFFLSNFIYILYLLLLFKLFTDFNTLNTVILFLFLSVLVLSLTYRYIFTIGTFIAVSGGFSGILLLIIFIITVQNISLKDSTFIDIFLLVYFLYLIIYTVAVLLYVLIYINLKLEDGSQLLTLDFNKFTTHQLSVSTKLILILLLSMAGIPPFTSFFIKLWLLSLVNISKFPPLLVLVTVFLFLFLMLIFYIKVVRFVLIQPQLKSLSFNREWKFIKKIYYFYDTPYILFISLLITILVGYGFVTDLLIMCLTTW